jgi:hypothetical protein
MNVSQAFDYDLFASLCDGDLVDYVEPFINSQPDRIPHAVYDRLMSEMSRFDTSHLVYALELGAILSPCGFALHVVKFLCHQDGAVCCAAFRVLSKLPTEAVTPQLITTIQEIPETDLHVLDPQSGEPRRVGTNKQFVHELLANLAGRARDK